MTTTEEQLEIPLDLETMDKAVRDELDRLYLKAQAKKLPVMEIFGPTIQGEGAMIGVRTAFIRFGLCDYKCVMCDSMHAVDPQRVRANAKWMTQVEIIDELVPIINSGCQWVTLSGGNPAIHDLRWLMESLNSNGIDVAIETQGTLNPDWISMCRTITVSPKTPGMGEQFELDKFMSFIEAYKNHPGFNVKVVVFSMMDIEFARTINEIMVDSGLYDKMYLSLGNPFPPGKDADDDVLSNFEGTKDQNLKLELLESYRQLTEDLLQLPDMSNVKFLPQLHVLTWANKQLV